MLSDVRVFLGNDQGASAVEYGLLIAGIAALVVVVVATLGGSLEVIFASTEACIARGAADPAGACGP